MTSAGLDVVLLRGVAYGSLIWGIYCAHRWLRSQSALMAHIFAAGVVGRLLLGIALYVVSLLELPVFKSLQRGNGFWALAIDAEMYFSSAAQAATRGISSVADGSASPAFVRLLALWMQIFGTSPVTGMLLNLACYVAVVLLIARFGRTVGAAIFGMIVFTFSPALIIFGTQPLKDTLCVFLLLLAGAGVRLWVDGLSMARRWHSLDPKGRGSKPAWIMLATGAALIMIATHQFGGIRAYVALFLIGAVALMAVAAAMSVRKTRDLVVVPAYITLLLLMGVAFSFGAGAYAASYAARGLSFAPASTLRMLDSLRAGFNRTAGGTALATKEEQLASSLPSPTLDDAAATGWSLGDLTNGGLSSRVHRFALGLSALFIPISALRALSLVTFDGGRGLLMITDIDTVFIDVALLGSFILLLRSRPTASSASVLLFLLALGLVTTVTMAYVVTNFGTLFRLRMLAVAPFWCLPVLVRGNEPPVALGETRPRGV